MPGNGIAVTGLLVAEQPAAVFEVSVCARTILDEYVLVVMAHLVPEMAEHRAVRLAETHPQGFAVVIERFDEVDGDDTVGVTDDHLFAGGVARQQIECEATVATPEGIDGQPDVGELVDHPPQGPCGRHQLLACQRVVGVGFPADRRVGQAAAALLRRLFLGCQPVAARRLDLCAPHPSLTVDVGGAIGDRHHRLRRQVEAELVWQFGTAERLERSEAVAHRAGECTHEPYGVTVQLLLIRHALPLRSEPGEGSDPDLSEEGIEQAKRLPDALARFPITRLVSSPQRRAVQTAQPVADGARADRSTSTTASPSTTATSSTTSRSSRSPPSTPRSWRGWPAATCRAPSTRTPFSPASATGSATSWTPGDHEDTVAVFSHGGVINGLLHSILRTEKILCVNVDYAGITRLLSSRTASSMSPRSTAPNTYGTCSREISGGRQVR